MLRKTITLSLIITIGLLFLSNIHTAAAQTGSSDCPTLNANSSGTGDLTFVTVANSVSLIKGEVITMTASNPTNPVLNVYLQVNGGLVNQTGGFFSWPVSLTYTIPSDGSYDIAASTLIMALGAGNSRSNYSVTCSHPVGQDDKETTSTKPLCPIFTDGRVNNCDPGQTIAIYCQIDGSISFYAIENSKGSKLFSIATEAINAVPKNPEVNTLIKEQFGVLFYRLTSGELQVMRPESTTGKYYKFIFNECRDYTEKQ